ncbi:MAG TPA: hypothetical protein EYQ00_09755 [Dehalococcoidia bacterium]|nr:hypothetical protein [Dehalococcoidia bacterium]
MKSDHLSDSENAELMLHLERTIPPMDLEDAETLLGEVKEIFDEHEVAFFLRQGTCLGAVRDHALIAWDDDLDLGSIIGMHGFTEEMIEPTVADLRASGCYVEVHREGLYTAVKIMKYQIRIDWQCYQVVKDTIAHYPGVPFPIKLFTSLTPIDFLGKSYNVPTPPDEYLTYKYGPDWITPKQVGYEKDVLDNMPSGIVPGRPGRLRQWFSVKFNPGQTATLLVLDINGFAVRGAIVVIAGLSRSTSNRDGQVKFYLPGPDNYAVAITFNGVEEVLYEEALVPGDKYIYRPDPTRTAGRYFVLTQE